MEQLKTNSKDERLKTKPNNNFFKYKWTKHIDQSTKIVTLV